MTPEQKMLKTLVSRDEEKQKLASMSADDLGEFLKEAANPFFSAKGLTGLGAATVAAPVIGGVAVHEFKKSKQKQANGDMLQYYQDHPEKLKAKQERDAKKEKKAEIEMVEGWAQELAKTAVSEKWIEEHAAKGSYDRQTKDLVGKGKKPVIGKPTPFPDPHKIKDVSKAFDKRRAKVRGSGRGALDAIKEYGRSQAARDVTPKPKGKLPVGKATMVAGGLTLAAYGAHKIHKHLKEKKEKEKVAVFSFNRLNEVTKMMGRVSRLAEKHGPAVKDMAGKAGKKVYEGVKNVGSRIGSIQDPIVKGMATGGVIGGVGGAAQGFLDPKENPYTGEKQRLRTAFRKGTAGAAGGMVSGALIGSMGKTGSVGSEKKASIPGLGGIGTMGKNFIASMAPTAHKALNAATPALRSGISRLGNATMGQAAGAGAVGGAALGAAKGLVAPGRDASGRPQSRLKAMAGGALGGGLTGGALGAGAKAALPRVQQFAAKKLGG